MLENKEDVLGELYCIKAGLSVISIEADKMSKMEGEIKEASDACAYQERQLDVATRNITELRKKQAKDVASSVGAGAKVTIKILFVVGCIVSLLVFGVLAFLQLKDGIKIDYTTSDRQELSKQIMEQLTM